ncbi:MAG: hypothetical protein VYE15_06490 [Myxococcota bacterium]|nr:hypothetical protein [Myxococcota bacterium]
MARPALIQGSLQRTLLSGVLLVSLLASEAASAKSPVPPAVVLLGFGPFEGYLVNPTDRLVREVAAGRAGWESETLPVDPRGALERLYSHLDRRPRLVIGVGVRADIDRIQLNPTALNWISMRDWVDWLHYGPIDPGLPVEIGLEPSRRSALVQAVEQEKLNVSISNDAGVHVCNLVLFHGLAHAPPGVGFLFIHVPSGILDDPRLRRTFQRTLEVVVPVLSGVRP